MKRPRVRLGPFPCRNPLNFTSAATFATNLKHADRESGVLGVAKRNLFATIAPGHDLAEAIVDAVPEPLLVLARDLRVIPASRSFYRTFAVTPRNTEGQLVFDLGDKQWDIPELRTVLEDIITMHSNVDAYAVEN